MDLLQTLVLTERDTTIMWRTTWWAQVTWVHELTDVTGHVWVIAQSRGQCWDIVDIMYIPLTSTQHEIEQFQPPLTWSNYSCYSRLHFCTCILCEQSALILSIVYPFFLKIFSSLIRFYGLATYINRMILVINVTENVDYCYW